MGSATYHGCSRVTAQSNPLWECRGHEPPHQCKGESPCLRCRTDNTSAGCAATCGNPESIWGPRVRDESLAGSLAWKHPMMLRMRMLLILSPIIPILPHSLTVKPHSETTAAIWNLRKQGTWKFWPAAFCGHECSSPEHQCSSAAHHGTSAIHMDGREPLVQRGINSTVNPIKVIVNYYHLGKLMETSYHPVCCQNAWLHCKQTWTPWLSCPCSSSRKWTRAKTCFPPGKPHIPASSQPLSRRCPLSSPPQKRVCSVTSGPSRPPFEFGWLRTVRFVAFWAGVWWSCSSPGSCDPRGIQDDPRNYSLSFLNHWTAACVFCYSVVS